MRAIKPQGVAVFLPAHHACTQARGVREFHSKTGTYAARGAYNQNPRLREEFIALRAHGLNP